ncbi:glutamyl-tRNA reductase [Nocardioides terrisoli]|uniref:glutamyl-tRNA reductase n=1 Tax=Nocardioides terrisoli TaxID=3388267 RepID=UPI00287B8B7B|nr:glutamyl-tRNA reductase [Nocardioides marmorisolisilvae]
MSVLVIGISHRSAPVSLLEQVALDADSVAKVISDVAANEHVTETTVLATCNRCEVYADVDRFHGSVEAISALLSERTGVPAEDLVPHLYVHYDDAAVSHLFSVASGLDSMAVGESQILGQARHALRVGQEAGTVGPSLNLLFQQALRIGKRVHAETDIDKAAPSLVSAALDRAAEHLDGLDGARALVVGAGAMAGLAVATLRRSGVEDIVVANRTRARADRLAQQYDVHAIDLADVPARLQGIDLLVSCTGSARVLVGAPELDAARHDGRPMAVVDLALPHDVDPAVAGLPGVRLIDLAALAAASEADPQGDDVAGVRAIVAEELGAFLNLRRTSSITPTVVALRSMATDVVDGELQRLLSRLPDLDPEIRAEVEQAVRRVADKLMHQPTVRIKELANEPRTVSYATALAELFSLDPEAVEAVTRVEGV